MTLCFSSPPLVKTASSQETLSKWLADDLEAKQVQTTQETLDQLRGTRPTVPRGPVDAAGLDELKGIILGLYKAAGVACAKSKQGRGKKCFVSGSPMLDIHSGVLIPLVLMVMMWPRTDKVAKVIKHIVDYATFLEDHGLVLTQEEKDVLQKLGPVTQVDSFERHNGKLLYGPGAAAGAAQHIQTGSVPVNTTQFATPFSKAGPMSMAMVDGANVNSADMQIWGGKEWRCGRRQERAQYRAVVRILADLYEFYTSEY